MLNSVIDAAAIKGIDLREIKKICISLDINGPLTTTDSAALKLYPDIKESINELAKLGAFIVINSAWDISTCKIFNQRRLGGIADGIIGENGYIYAIKESKPVFMVDIDTKSYILDLFIKTLNECSSMGYSFADQGNLVNACYYHEFEGGLTQNICREGLFRPNLMEFHHFLHKRGLDTKMSNGCVEFNETRENYQLIHKVLANECKLISIRPNISDDKIRIQIGEYVDKNINLSDLYVLSKRVLRGLDGWTSYKVNNDFCIDYFLSKKIMGTEITKAVALDAFLEKMCERIGYDRNDFIILGIGDEERDTCIRNLEKSLFFGLMGTESQKNCDLVVSDGLAFLQLAKGIIKLLDV